jgi:hypothetical protein
LGDARWRSMAENETGGAAVFVTSCGNLSVKVRKA